ncbi:hypothetical protein F1C10_02625 [Sphingomonas sp. NBWT7]|uniref:hypothetical protein n=1 Tax=Sphingomonas sp. NBWT7 TaxID=2596913 RepID=UPI001629C07F|nr:hypothetical protein [Sphingomonas sp. NBWT7]QNE30959.1 hypothetical protein F1C10_02625 [Sphingomonas sp. NBWT7]
MSFLAEQAGLAHDLARQWATQRATGFIETICVEDPELVWVTGWMVDDGVVDRPVVILDDGAFDGSFAYALAPRDDLPSGCLAFAGIVHSGWRPQAGPPFRMFMADGSARILESLDPTRLVTKTAIAPSIRDILNKSAGPMRGRLQELFHEGGAWFEDPAPASPERIQIDEAAVLPGFGVFVNGWVLSTRKEARSFMLKAGTTVVGAEDGSVVRYPRPDIAALKRDIDQSLVPSGFIALFRGTFDDAAIDGVMVKATWNDGKGTAAAIPPGAVRVIGRTAPIDIVERFYPAIEAERFFPVFAHHAAVMSRARRRNVTAHVVAPVGHALILAVPSSPSDFMLLVDDIMRNAWRLPETTGIVLIAGTALQRSLTLSLFADVQRHSGRRCSLFFSPLCDPTSDAIDPITTALELDSFAFVSGHVRLTERGWSAVGTAPRDVSFLAIDDPADTTLAPVISTDACLATRDWWQADVAGRTHRSNGNDGTQVSQDRGEQRAIITQAALSLGQPRISRLAARIDQALEIAGG